VRSYGDLVHAIPGAENYADVTARAVPGLHRLLDDYPTGDAVVCAHKHVNRCLLAGLGLISAAEAIHIEVPLDQPILLEVFDWLQDSIRRRSFRILSGIDLVLICGGQTWNRHTSGETQWRREDE
jgi:broad specificity phosphatase PhoE